MKTNNSTALILCASLLAEPAQAAFVYETSTEFLSAGDFNGDGFADVLVLDKLTGNARVGYSDGNGGLTWSAPLITGVENATGLGIEHFLQKTNDAIALASPALNQVNLLDLSHTNFAPAPQSFTPPGIGPHSLAGLRAPRASISPGVPFLLVASSFNNASAELLDLLQWTNSVLSYGQFGEIAPLDRLNALDIGSGHATLGVGLARGEANDALHLWEFDTTPGIVGAFSNLPSGSAYAFATFNGEPLPRFIFFQPGGSNVVVAPLQQTNSLYAFGAGVTVPLGEPVQGVFTVILGTNSAALIQFSDGVQGLTLPGGTPALSTKYQTGAGAAANVFTGIVPLTSGMFALLDAPPAGAASVHAQVVQFNGASFTRRSSSILPSLSARGSRANVWLFQLEPFVNRSPGFIASLNSPDWADSVSGLPGAVQVPTEADSGAAIGLGAIATNNLGTAPSGAAFGIANQYNSAISLFSYAAPHAAAPVAVAISPPAGAYGSPQHITFTVSPSGAGAQYRLGSADSWHSYSAFLPPIFITNDTVVEFYGTNPSGSRSSLQLAAYSLGNPAAGGTGAPVVIDPTNTNTPPALGTNQLVLSQDGTLFYGRRSAANAGTIWAINLDGSGETYITTGARPRVSLDGRWLAFLRDGNPFGNQGNIWVRDLQSGAERRLFVNHDLVSGYDWETNNSVLLLDYACGIWDLNLSGALSPLLSADCFDDAPVRNAVDGRIAFHNLSPNNTIAGLYLADADGASRHRIVGNVPGASWPAWSPDGLELVFSDGNNTNLDSGKNLWITDALGVELSQISGFTDATNGFPHGALWLPDGSGLVAAGTVFDTNGLWVIPLVPGLGECDGLPYLLPTSAGDPIDFAGSIVVAPSTVRSIPQAPGLFIRQDTNAITVYWSTNFVGFTLQSVTNLPANGNWVSIPGPYYLSGGYYQYVESKAALQAAKFFRLAYAGVTIISPGPSLSLRLAANHAILSWPAAFAGFTLESKTSLQLSAPWTAVAGSYALNGLNFEWHDPALASAGARFYRLRGP